MPRYGYIDSLLNNLAVDYSRKSREGLIAPLLFPRVPVGKPFGKYPVFDAESAFKVPDVELAGEQSQANILNVAGATQNYATSPRGLKSFISKDDLEFMDCPFRLYEKQAVERLTSKLELAQEKRVANKVLALPGCFTSLSGSGTAKTNKWTGTGEGSGGDSFGAVNDATGNMLFRPNLMILNEAVYDAIEYHPVLLAKLGEANLIKKVDEQTLAKLFRVDKVVIAKGKADFGKRNKDKSLTLSSVWGDCVALAYASAVWDEPCAGKTVAVKYRDADNQGFVVRTWDEADGGVLGGEFVQVAHDVDEMVVCKELIYTIKDIL
jgi:hypothetical protein